MVRILVDYRLAYFMIEHADFVIEPTDFVIEYTEFVIECPPFIKERAPFIKKPTDRVNEPLTSGHGLEPCVNDLARKGIVNRRCGNAVF